MSEPHPTVPGSPRPSGGDRRPLDRAPGERYITGSGGRTGSGGAIGSGGAMGSGGSRGSGPAPGPRTTRALVTAMAIADAGALLVFLFGQLDLGIGLVAVAAFTGWTTALALVWWGRGALPIARMRVAIGACLGAWTVVGGMLLDWILGLVQGGGLGPLDYAVQRYGLVALLALVVASGIAAVRVR